MKLSHAAALLVCASILPLPSAAQDAKEEQKAPKMEEKAAPKKGGMSQDQMMKAWQEFATPAQGHKKMERAVGTWNAKVKMWMAPGAPPEESEGTMESAWIMEGRYIEERFKGTAMGQPFEGQGVMGYDNAEKKYFSTWIDNMGTGIMFSKGSFDASGKTLTMTSTMTDPITKKLAKIKTVSTMPDDDHMHMEMWGPDHATGKVYKSLEIEYTRKK